MFLVRSIAHRATSLGITELVLMDTDLEKLSIFGGMARHIARILAPEMDLRLTTDPVDAVQRADYVITTLRVGGDEMRSKDERIALDLGVLGQETTGAAGFSFAMRTVPILKKYCELIRKHATPHVKVFNFTNPVGIVSQALRDAGYDFTYGICDAPSGMLNQFGRLFDAPPAEVSGEMFGLNHLSWFFRIFVKGNDIVPWLIHSERAHTGSDLRLFEPDLLSFLGFVPNEYLFYYYYRERAVENILNAGKTRGEIIMETNREMIRELKLLDIENDFDGCLDVFTKWYAIRENQYMANESGVRRETSWSFDPYASDDGGYAGVALRFIDILQSGKPGDMILTVPNQNAVDFLPETDTVEVTCTVSADGCNPHRFENIPPDIVELIRRVKYYERMGAMAINRRDRKAAVSCLMMHPLVNSYSLAVSLADRYILQNADYTGKWEG